MSLQRRSRAQNIRERVRETLMVFACVCTDTVYYLCINRGDRGTKLSAKISISKQRCWPLFFFFSGVFCSSRVERTDRVCLNEIFTLLSLSLSLASSRAHRSVVCSRSLLRALIISGAQPSTEVRTNTVSGTFSIVSPSRCLRSASRLPRATLRSCYFRMRQGYGLSVSARLFFSSRSLTEFPMPIVDKQLACVCVCVVSRTKMKEEEEERNKKQTSTRWYCYSIRAAASRPCLFSLNHSLRSSLIHVLL